MNDTKKDSLVQKGYYQHYKGQHYEVIGLGEHSESGEALVFYRALYGEFGLWARPLEMFTETVDIDGETVPRFRYVPT